MTAPILRRARALASHPAAFAAFLFALCAAAYGLLIPRLGFYWDDFPINWIATTMGAEGLARYFSTNRPVWGLVYQVTTPILGSAPLPWHIFALVMRWLTGLLVWLVLRQIWPERKQFAAWGAALFVLYPGFSQQSIAFLYSHFYIILACFLLSLALMAGAARRPQQAIPLSAASLLLSLLNLLAMEYFFLLDLLRPFILWIVLSESVPNPRRRILRVLSAWLPYLAVFSGAMVWRSLLFGFHTYQPALMDRLRAQPLQALAGLIPTVVQDVFKTSVLAWGKAFSIPSAAAAGSSNLLRYWILVAVVAAGSFLFLHFYQPGESARKRRWAAAPVALGLLALLIAGGPFWLTDLPISLVFSNDRFNLAFMPGASLVFAGALAWLPIPRGARLAALSLALGFASGLHFQSALAYSQDWNTQSRMFWQMTWRMPGIRPGTVLLANELPVRYYTDNSLSAPLNWIYDPENDPNEMEYMLIYPSMRREDVMENLQENLKVKRDFLAAAFHGSPNQVITFYYEPPGCLRVLDPEIEQANWMVPEVLRETLSLASTGPILSAPPDDRPPAVPPAHIYGPEIAHGWCYYFEKGDLARQHKDWETVAALGDQAFAAGDYPNDPVERFPFIEGYAHTGRWERALELSRETIAITPVSQPMLCSLWERIRRETAPGAQQEQALLSIRQELACSSR